MTLFFSIICRDVNLQFRQHMILLLLLLLGQVSVWGWVLHDHILLLLLLIQVSVWGWFCDDGWHCCCYVRWACEDDCVMMGDTVVVVIVVVVDRWVCEDDCVMMGDTVVVVNTGVRVRLIVWWRVIYDVVVRWACEGDCVMIDITWSHLVVDTCITILRACLIPSHLSQE